MIFDIAAGLVIGAIAIFFIIPLLEHLAHIADRLWYTRVTLPRVWRENERKRKEAGDE